MRSHHKLQWPHFDKWLQKAAQEMARDELECRWRPLIHLEMEYVLKSVIII